MNSLRENGVRATKNTTLLTKPMSEEDNELIKDLIPWYLRSEQENIGVLEAALAKRDFASLIEIGDKMFGHGSSYGFPLISTLGKRIEVAAIGQDTFLLSSLISSLKAHIKENIKNYSLE